MSKRKSKRNQLPTKGFKRGFGQRTQFSQNENYNTYLYAKAGEYTDVNGVDYEGEYHIIKDGRVFTGPIPLDQEKSRATQLMGYYASPDVFAYDKLNNFVSPIRDYSQPTPHQYVIEPGGVDYRVGFSVRYFVQKFNNTGYPIEIDKTQREAYGSDGGIDNSLYNLINLQWMLVGTLELIERENRKNIAQASQTMPDISLAISSLTQYAQPTAQTNFANTDSLLVNPKLSNNIVPIKKTFNRETGEII
jgi:hypothetical protein